MELAYVNDLKRVGNQQKKKMLQVIVTKRLYLNVAIVKLILYSLRLVHL
jgi:hypothetical protein